MLKIMTVQTHFLFSGHTAIQGGQFSFGLKNVFHFFIIIAYSKYTNLEKEMILGKLLMTFLSKMVILLPKITKKM